MDILASIKLIQSLDHKDTHTQLRKWEHFAVINHTKVWQNPEFYKNAVSLVGYSKLSFGNFLREAFRYSIGRYNRMEQIYKLKDGKKLFLKYGFCNMSTYLNSTETEREAIITKYKTCVSSRSFISIKRELFPPKSKEKQAVDYKAKYNEAKKEIEKLKTKMEAMQTKYEGDIHKLKEAITVLSVAGSQTQQNISFTEKPKTLN
jgi:uncharacterized protein YqgV (UPF0045/DUF77 family)